MQDVGWGWEAQGCGWEKPMGGFVGGTRLEAHNCGQVSPNCEGAICDSGWEEQGFGQEIHHWNSCGR